MVGWTILLFMVIYVITIIMDNFIVSSLVIASLIVLIVLISRNSTIRDKKISEEFEIRREAAKKQLKWAIKGHATTLATKRRQLVVPDSYGNEDTKKWEAEKKYFIEHVGLISDKHVTFGEANSLIEDAVRTQIRRDKKDIRKLSARNISPIEYEHQCASVLRGCGWNAVVTKSSGDQGVDILATMNGIKVVVQCKKYTSPVGNAAVQEVIAGKEFEDATHAVVVTNASFTTSARSLANKCNVLLLHDSELDQLYRRLPKQ